MCLLPLVTRACLRTGAAAYLGSIGVICWLFWVQIYSLGVEIYSCRPVVRSESFVTLILEGNSFFSGHGEKNGVEPLAVILVASRRNGIDDS